MKTIKQHLEILKEPYRTQALNNLDKDWKDKEYKELYLALTMAFIWENTQEGSEYWDNVHTEILLNNPNYFEIQSS